MDECWIDGSVIVNAGGWKQLSIMVNLFHHIL